MAPSLPFSRTARPLSRKAAAASRRNLPDSPGAGLLLPPIASSKPAALALFHSALASAFASSSASSNRRMTRAKRDGSRSSAASSRITQPGRVEVASSSVSKTGWRSASPSRAEPCGRTIRRDRSKARRRWRRAAQPWKSVTARASRERASSRPAPAAQPEAADVEMMNQNSGALISLPTILVGVRGSWSCERGPAPASDRGQRLSSGRSQDSADPKSGSASGRDEKTMKVGGRALDCVM